VSPEETNDFEQAVSRARERIEDLSGLMLVANALDRQAGDVILDDDGEPRAS